MIIRKATIADLPYIKRALAAKRIPYITSALVNADIEADRLFLIEKEGRPIAQAALLWDENNQYWAIKRMCVYRKTNSGGIAYVFFVLFLFSWFGPARRYPLA